jgi:hypothetical protein
MHFIIQGSPGKYLIKSLLQSFFRKLPATLMVAALPLTSLDDATKIEFFLYALVHPKKPGQIPYQIAVADILYETIFNTDNGSTSLGFFG